MRVLITGAAGFIGHHVAEAILRNTDWEVVGLDRLDTSGTLHRLTEIESWETHRRRVSFVWHDLRAPINTHVASRLGRIDRIIHLAAGTHVDRSIAHPMEFVLDNVVATCNLLEYARTLDTLEQFVYFSTDEVFGPAPNQIKYKEWDRYRSGNPYAATKAGGEELAISYENTYKMPLIVLHTMNVFGERQHSEKFIPMTIRNVTLGSKVSIHADPTRTIPGSRFYIHARNVADALLFLSRQWSSGEKYNIVGEREVNNLELAQKIAEVVGKPLIYELVDFHASRPGHDLRYALDGAKLKSMGFSFPKTFDESLTKTVRWTLDHPEWLA